MPLYLANRFAQSTLLSFQLVDILTPFRFERTLDPRKLGLRFTNLLDYRFDSLHKAASRFDALGLGRAFSDPSTAEG